MKKPPVNEYLRLLSAGEKLESIGQRYGVKANAVGMALQRAGMPSSQRQYAQWVADGNDAPDAFVGPIVPRLHGKRGPGPIQSLTIDVIHDRCEEFGDCLLWKGALTTHLTTGTPSARHEGKTVNVRRLVWKLAHPGVDLRADQLVVTSCREGRCLCQAHLQRKTRAVYAKQLAGEGVFSDIVSNRRRRDGARAVAKKLTMEAAREIRAAKATAKELAQRFGVSVSLINQIRTNVLWSELPRHAMPVNSVFALGAAA
jgi:hypothetical protein